MIKKKSLKEQLQRKKQRENIEILNKEIKYQQRSIR